MIEMVVIMVWWLVSVTQYDNNTTVTRYLHAFETSEKCAIAIAESNVDNDMHLECHAIKTVKLVNPPKHHIGDTRKTNKPGRLCSKRHNPAPNACRDDRSNI
jgi:hypothetical protein